MGLEDLNTGIKLIKNEFEDDEVFLHGPISEDLVRQAEDTLNCKFPLSYKSFLSQYGYGGVDSFDVDGVTSHIVPGDEIQGGVVWNVLQRRKKFGLCDHIIPLSEIGDGSYYALDLSQMNAENECPVVIWPLNGYEDTPVLEVVAKDFGEFFLNMVKEEIEMKFS